MKPMEEALRESGSQPHSFISAAKPGPDGKQITLDNATLGAGIPFHPGAERFYKEAGKLK